MSLAKALLEVQKELPAIEPDSVNPHFKNRYVSLNRLLAVTLPILHKHGIVLVQMPCLMDGQPALTTALLNDEDKIEATMPLMLEKDNSQGLGSAITYGRRFMLAAMLGVSGEKDDDGEAASATPKPKKTTSKPAVPRGEKMRVRIQELAQEADKLREADPGTTWAEVIKVIDWNYSEWENGKRPERYGATWDGMDEPGLTWLGLELGEYVNAGATGMSFYEHVTVPF